MARLALLLSALALVPGAIRAQDTPKPSDDRWQIGLENGQYIWDIRLVRLQGDTLVFRQADTLGTVSVQQIGELRLIQKSTMRIGQGAAGRRSDQRAHRLGRRGVRSAHPSTTRHAFTRYNRSSCSTHRPHRDRGR
jgi:hypothetical protein